MTLTRRRGVVATHVCRENRDPPDGVNIGGGSVAEAVLKENLRKVLGIEGAARLDPADFSSDNIGISFDAPENGRARFTVLSPCNAGGTYFMRVKIGQ